MRTSLHVAVAVGLALNLSGITAEAQAPAADERAILMTLGPDGFASAPPLGALVGGTVAAIVGRVVGTERLTRRQGGGYAGYRVAVDAVVFARPAAGVLPLVAGTEISLDQRVGRDSAERFLARRLPVAPADTCLLFLGDGPAGVTLSGWTVQFRRVPGPAPTAQTLGPATLATEMAKPYWFGPGVRMVATTNGAAPEWESLLAEVRRLGTLEASPARGR